MRFVVPLALFLALPSGSAPAVLLLGAEDSRAVQSPQSSTSKNDLQAVRNDLERMKALVQQMESNLAFVDTTQSPLKHQFQLEIDMWKTLIGEMERKINAAGDR